MKKNIRQIPTRILQKIKYLEPEFVACCVKTFDKVDIDNGDLKHLGIITSGKKIIIPKEILPDAKQGKHSNWNIKGREIKRTDLPKEKFYNYVEAPNWGDSYNGTHTVALPGERYPVQYIPPRYSKIIVEHLNQDSSSSKLLIRFIISEVLNTSDNDFQDRLFDCLNILQENIGDCDIDKADISKEVSLKTHEISWEILPPGSKADLIARLFKGRQYTPQSKNVAEIRYDFFNSLNPLELIVGSNGFQRYFGAKLEEDLVLFENVDYGNALYIMYDNWKVLSAKTRIELLSGRYGKDFDRIIHSGDWKQKVRLIVRDKRRKNKK